MAPAVATTASSLLRRVLWEAASALRILFRLGTDAVLYGFLFTAWAGFSGGMFLDTFGIRVCGEGSTVQAFGAALQSHSFDVLVRLFPAFVPLYLMRLVQRLVLERKQGYKRKKPSGLVDIISDKLFSRDPMLRRRALTPWFLYTIVRAITIQLNLGIDSLDWRVVFAFCDTTALCFEFLTMFLVVRELALVVTLPRERDVSL